MAPGLPIGAEQTATGYEVAWSVPGGDQYWVWNTDSSGNYVSDSGVLSGTSAALQSFETSFQQDLNGDGTIGAPTSPVPTVIESFGSTSLAQSGSNYLLEPNGGTAVKLSYGGAPVTAGQFGSWTPIGAEQTATGYEVAWRVPGATSIGFGTPTAAATTSRTVGSIRNERCVGVVETSFQQDLNGDGTIGAPLPAVIETFGSTSLARARATISLSRAAVKLRYGEAPVTAGSLAAGLRSGRSRRRQDTRSLGGSPAPTSIGFGTPTAAAISSQLRPASCRERALCSNCSRPVSTRI